MIRPILLALSIALALPSAAAAQAPQPLPARLDAAIELPGPGPARFLNATIDLGRGLPWSIVGCVSSARGPCSATSSIVLDDAARAELVQRIAAVQQRLRCPPPAAAPGDPSFTIDTPSGPWVGTLPRDPAQVAARTGTCAASAALAWWIVQRFGVPGLTAPQGGGR